MTNSVRNNGYQVESMADIQARQAEEHRKLQQESAAQKREIAGVTQTVAKGADQALNFATKQLKSTASGAQKASLGLRVAKEGAQTGVAASAKVASMAAKAIPVVNIAATAIDIGVTVAQVALTVSAALDEGNESAAIQSATNGARTIGSKGYEVLEDRRDGQFSSKATSTLEAAQAFSKKPS